MKNILLMAATLCCVFDSSMGMIFLDEVQMKNINHCEDCINTVNPEMICSQFVLSVLDVAYLHNIYQLRNIQNDGKKESIEMEGLIHNFFKSIDKTCFTELNDDITDLLNKKDKDLFENKTTEGDFLNIYYGL